MRQVFDTLSLAVAAAGLLVLAAALALRRRGALAVTLELWTAAGLLRLAGEPSWARIASAAAIISVRHLVVARRPALSR